jgi:uncharacterized membrane-anchored protein YhcB (DUF1043 family)
MKNKEVKKMELIQDIFCIGFLTGIAVGLLIAVLIDELVNKEKYKSLLEQWKKGENIDESLKD